MANPLRWIELLFPAFMVFLATVVISAVIANSSAIFLARSTFVIVLRFVLMTTILLIQLPLIPRLLSLIVNRVDAWKSSIWEFVRARSRNFLARTTVPEIWILRPLQGIGLSMIFAERVLNIFEISERTSVTEALARPFLFTIGGILVALLLSTVWALDDLGIRLYFGKTGEVRMIGSIIGTTFPILFGVLGVYTLFENSGVVYGTFLTLGIVAILYPPYNILAIIHNSFMARYSQRFSIIASLRSAKTELR